MEVRESERNVEEMLDNASVTRESILLPAAVVAALLVCGTWCGDRHVFHESAFPSPLSVVRGFGEEIRSGRLFNDLITSLFRVSVAL